MEWFLGAVIGLVVLANLFVSLWFREILADEGWARWISSVNNLVSMSAIVVGSVWFLINFGLTRVAAPRLVLTVKPEVIDLPGAEALLYIHVYLKNVGQVEIVPDGDKNSSRGCQLVVYRFPESAAEALATNEGPVGAALVDWGGSGSQKILKDMNMLKYYDNYYIDPGVELHEVEAVRVKKGVLYGVRVKFYKKGNDISDAVYRYIPEGEAPGGGKGDGGNDSFRSSVDH